MKLLITSYYNYFRPCSLCTHIIRHGDNYFIQWFQHRIFIVSGIAAGPLFSLRQLVFKKCDLFWENQPKRGKKN